MGRASALSYAFLWRAHYDSEPPMNVRLAHTTYTQEIDEWHMDPSLLLTGTFIHQRQGNQEILHSCHIYFLAKTFTVISKTHCLIDIRGLSTKRDTYLTFSDNFPWNKTKNTIPREPTSSQAKILAVWRTIMSPCTCPARAPPGHKHTNSTRVFSFDLLHTQERNVTRGNRVYIGSCSLCVFVLR